MSQEQFGLVGNAVAVGVFVGNGREPGRDVLRLARLGQLDSQGTQPGAERVVRKFVESFWRLVGTGQMTGRAAIEFLCQETVVMPVQRGFVGGRGEGHPGRRPQRTRAERGNGGANGSSLGHDGDSVAEAWREFNPIRRGRFWERRLNFAIADDRRTVHF